MFCNDCAASWRKESETCPQCREKFVPRPINRKIKNLLEAKEFRCDKCQAVFKYKDHQAHVRAHHSKPIEISPSLIEDLQQRLYAKIKVESEIKRVQQQLAVKDQDYQRVQQQLAVKDQDYQRVQQ